MIESQSNLDLCLIGPKGCGKSITVEKIAELLNYQVEPIILYQVSLFKKLIQLILLIIKYLKIKGYDVQRFDST